MSQIISLYKTRIGDNPMALQLFKKFEPDYPNLRLVFVENVLRFEYEDGVNPDIDRLGRIFCYLETEKMTTQPSICGVEVIEISYQRAWTDPELQSIFHAAEALGVDDGLKWVRLATRYKFVGIDRVTAEEIASHFLYNSTSQTVVRPGEVWDSLRPRGQHESLAQFDLAIMSLGRLMALSDERRWFLAANQ